MSFKAKKTALVAGLCFLGMAPVQQASAATESVASVQQTKQATGYVADSQGPLIGATVMEKGTNNEARCNTCCILCRLCVAGNQGWHKCKC